MIEQAITAANREHALAFLSENANHLLNELRRRVGEERYQKRHVVDVVKVVPNGIDPMRHFRCRKRTKLFVKQRVVRGGNHGIIKASKLAEHIPISVGADMSMRVVSNFRIKISQGDGTIPIERNTNFLSHGLRPLHILRGKIHKSGDDQKDNRIIALKGLLRREILFKIVFYT